VSPGRLGQLFGTPAAEVRPSHFASSYGMVTPHSRRNEVRTVSWCDAREGGKRRQDRLPPGDYQPSSG
jgi:hypothetical protein